MATGSAGEPWAATHGRVTLLRELSRQGRPPPSGACRSPEGRVPENCSHPVRWPRGRAGEGDIKHGGKEEAKENVHHFQRMVADCSVLSVNCFSDAIKHFTASYILGL